MAIKSINFLLIFCCFFSLILSETEVIKFKENGIDEKKDNSNSYQIDFSDVDLKNYIHFKVTSKSEHNQLVIISEDEDCKENRKALGIQTYDPIHLFISNKEINSKKTLFLCIQCQQEDTCTYTINIKMEDKCQLKFGEQTSYYVNSLNEKMDFTFNGNIPNNLRNLEEDYESANIWIKGQDIESTELNIDKGILNGNPFENGNIYLIDKIDSSFYNLTVQSKEGDYVTIGSLKIIKDYMNSKILRANDLEIMGIFNNNSRINKICFQIDNYPEKEKIIIAQINGIVYTKKAGIYYIRKNNPSEITKEIQNGVIFEHINITEVYNQTICVTYPNNETKVSKVIFSLQLTSSEINNYNQFYYAPQLPGIIYTHYLPKNGIAVFRSMKPKNGSKEVSYNMKAIKGYPDMFFDLANDFPYSEYNEKRLSNCKNPHHANRMTSYNVYINDNDTDYSNCNPLTIIQPILIVHCINGTNEQEKMSSFCEFETSIFTNKDEINLLEEDTYTQYLLKDEKDQYTINIEYEDNLKKVYLDLIVFSGDVNLEIDSEDIKQNANKYYLSNKIFYSIHANKNNKNIDFHVKAQKNSFYLVVYKLVRENDISGNVNKIESGINFIESIYVGDEADYLKYFDMENLKYNELSPFLASFYSQNCEFSILRKIYDKDGNEKEEQYIPMYDYYGQIIIDENDANFNCKEHRFRIEILKDDVSEYENKVCMIYATGLEYSNSEEGSEKTVSVSEGVPQYYKFSPKYPYMKYTYFVSETNNQLVISFHLIDEGIYKVKILHNYIIIKEQEIYRDDQMFLNKTELKQNCLSENEVCPIDVFIKLNNTDLERRLETTIYQVRGAPIYLEKNAVKQDILLGSVKKHFYFDIGHNESGDITIDHIRGSGYIYAKIENKTQVEGIEGYYYDWRGMYNFPNTKNESLRYETYFKKIDITKENTKYCDKGCYVLITVESSLYDESELTEDDPKLVPYRITITPKINPNRYEESLSSVPKVKMFINQFIIGNVYRTKDKILTYYQVNLPYDSEYILFDWQADIPRILINVGKDRPTFNGSDFAFETAGDTVLKLDKKKILECAKEKFIYTNSTENINLTIGIVTHKLDTLYTSVFAFKIFMSKIYPNNSQQIDESIINMVYIRSDQKVQCLPIKNSDGIFICVFAVIFDEGDVGKNLVVYPKAQRENFEVEYSGLIVDSEKVEKNDFEYISDQLNNEKQIFPTEKGKKYIYYEKIDRKKCVLFKVTLKNNSIIEVLSSIYTYSDNQIFIPNPSTPQVFAIGEKQIAFNFETTQDLLINFVCISGEGEFYWEVKEEENIRYYMYDFEDRISLTSGTYNKSESLSNLIIKSTSFTMFETDEAGFVFYITFYPRNKDYNIDQLKIGRSTEFEYRDLNFPLNYYTKLTSNEISVGFSFYNYFLNKDKKILYDKTDFKIWGVIITEKEALDARITEVFRPKEENAIYGSFDGAFASLFLNENEINSFGIKKEDIPYLFFSIEPKKEIKNINGLSLEVSLLNANQLDYFAPEYVYLNGKFKDNSNNNRFVYKLRTDPKNQYMRVEFSANSKLIKWDVSKDENLNKLIEEEKRFINGRYIMTFQVEDTSKPLYLVIYSENTKIDPKLGNYIFKYMNAKSKDIFFEFEQEKTELKYSVKKENGKKIYNVSFYPVEHYDVNYYVKAIYKNSEILNEDQYTIAITESNGYYLQVDNPKFESYEMSHLIFEIPDNKTEISYFKIMAKVNFDYLKEYLVYKPIEVYEGELPPDYNDYIDVSPKLDETIQEIYNTDKKQVKFKVNNPNRNQKYKISFNDYYEIPDYIRVRVNASNTNKNKFKKKVVSFFPNEEGKTRLQISQLGVDNIVDMWVKREQLEEKYLFITVECKVDNDNLRCNEDYYIEFEGSRYATIPSITFNYNYYVSKNNTKMVFAITNDLNISKITDQYITFYAIGEKNITLSLGNYMTNDEQYNFRDGVAITTKMEAHDFFLLKVEAKEGYLISIGSKVTHSNGQSYQNKLRPNDHVYTGYLKKNYLQKECYTIPSYEDENLDKISYIVGIFYEKIAEISFKYENFTDIKELNQINTKGYISYVQYNGIYEFNRRKYICVGFPQGNNYKVENIAYTLQITQPTKQIGLYNFYSPQLRGNIYPRIISKGDIVFFNAANLDTDADEIIYNMITLEGMPKMFINKCLNYPLCDFDLSNKKEVKAINEINRMSSWHNKDYIGNTSPIDKEQYIMIVNCIDLENSKSNICRFETAIYGNNDEINLIEEESFSQYLLKGKNTTYIIDYSIEKKVTKVQVDNFIVNGDAKIDLFNENNEKINSHEYYLANKNFFSINLSQNIGLKKIIAIITAGADTYYTIEYKLVRESQEELVNDIYTGINYLIPILPSVDTNKKRVNIKSIKLLEDDLFFASFYSFNCRFKIERADKDKAEVLKSYVDYAQDIIDPENEDEQRFVHSYDISVVEPDISKYKNNMCILYVSGLDITKEEEREKDIAQKEILIGEGIPQRAIFKENLRKIKYIYPDPDKESHVAIFFKVINPAYYKYTITYNNKEEDTKSFYASHIDYLDKLMATGHCGENELCNIIITIYVQEIKAMEPILEVTVKQINNIPYYIPKEVVKEDYVPGNSSLYLYTTLGEDDEGYVTVDFYRGSGLIYAKIVGFDDPVDKYPDWRKYTFPKEQNDSLYYEFYNKRIKISNEKTHKCKNGCYLLINLRSSVSGSFNEKFRFHLFTITVSLTQSGELKKFGIKNKIDPEDYAIGSLSNLEKIKSKDMYEFYQITIPYDADKVEFDWQSDAALLLVNVGENRPIYGNNSFNSSSVYGRDSLISIMNEQIKSFLLVDNYITNVILTLGIYTEDLESVLGTQYSFRVHFSKELNIYKVSSDQKTICKPDKLNDNEYRCLFMVTYAELDFIYDLMIYSRSQSALALTNMYADFIKKEIYDSRKTEELKAIIPNEKSRFNTKKAEIDFIFLTLAEVNCHLYVSVISDKPEDIEFITSFKTFDDEMSPNPSSIQLFAMNNQNKMKLNFKTTKGLFINIESLVGYSNIYLQDEINVNYTLRGKDDKLSLAIPSSNNIETILIIENMNKDDLDDEIYFEDEDNKTPKLAFMVEYFLRGNEINFDEVYVGQTSEIVYKKADLPLYYYSKIKDLDYNINAFFALHDLVPNIININSQGIVLKGSVITQRTIYHVKLGEEIKPNVDKYPITGVYDPSLKVGQITFSKEDLQAFHIDKNPYIYLSFEKGSQPFKLDKLRIELTILRENEDVFISEKSYQFGKLKDKKIVNKYKLKVDNSTGDMRIQFSTNSKYIDFAINNGEDEKKNITYENLEKKVERGKIFVTFQKPKNRRYIYLNVFLKDNYTSSDIIINNYAFKYINSINRSNFFEYEILDNDGTLQKKEDSQTILIKCNKIDTNRNVRITYSLKAVASKNMKVELFNNIALSESIANITEVTNIIDNDLNEIMFEIIKDHVDYSYFQVIAQIIDGPIIEYVAYDPIGDFSFYDDVKAENENKSDENSSKNVKTLITVIIIAAILLIGVIVLVIIILTYNAKNKNLMEQVNKISFVKSGVKPIEDKNLLLDNQNELE